MRNGINSWSELSTLVLFIQVLHSGRLVAAVRVWGSINEQERLPPVSKYER